MHCRLQPDGCMTYGKQLHMSYFCVWKSQQKRVDREVVESQVVESKNWANLPGQRA